jgi:hypothetical protein
MSMSITMEEFSASVYMNRAFEKAASSAATDFTTAAVHHLASTYGFDAAEAMAKLGLESVIVKKSAGRKKGEGKAKSPKAKASKRLVPEIPLPWCGVSNDEWCSGLRLSHGLHSQCTNAKREGEYCGTCQRQADKNSSGKPTYGTTVERLTTDVLEFRCPKSGKQTLPYANVMKKLGIARSRVEEEAEKFGLSIPEEHFVERKTQRGRPKKDSSASDTDSDASTPKKRGRPTKEKKVIASSVGDDLIASLVASSNSLSSEPVVALEVVTIAESPKSDKSPKKSPQEKAQRKAAQAAKIVELRAEWSVMANARPGKQVVDGQGQMSVMSESQVVEAATSMTKIGDLQKALVSMRRIIKTEEKEEKEAIRKAAEAVILKESQQQELVQEKMNEEEEDSQIAAAAVEQTENSNDEDSDDDGGPTLKVVRFTHNGVKYLKTAEQMLYFEEGQLPAGMWNPESETITPVEECSDDDDSDEDDT